MFGRVLLLVSALATLEAADLEKLFEAGEYRQAEADARQAITTDDERPEAIETARMLELLAKAQVALAHDLDAAEAEAARAGAIKARLLRPGDPSIAGSLAIQGEVKRLRSDYPAAIALFERARAMHPADAEMADVLNGLGMAMQDTGRYSEARKLHEQALAIRERVSGAESTTAAEVLINLGGDCWLSGEMKLARQYLDRALAMLEKTAGTDHPLTASALGNIGAVLKLTNDYAAARPYYERSVAIYEKRLGPDHPKLATQLNNLGLCLKELDDYEHAGALLERAVGMFERTLGADNSRSATVLANLGIVYQGLDDFTRARQAYERALAIQQKRLGPEHPLVASILNSLGLLFHRLGDFAQSRRYLTQSLAIYEKKSGPKYPKTVDVLVSLGDALIESGDAAGARRYFERALAVRREILEPESEGVAIALQRLGETSLRLGDYKKAREQLEEALRIERKLGNDELHASNCLTHLGDLSAAQGDFAQAAHYHQEAIELRTKTLGAENHFISEPKSALASDLRHLGRREEALRDALEAARIWRQHVQLTLQATPERQALLMVAEGNDGLNVALNVAAESPDLPAAGRRSVWDALIRGRALALDEMAERHRTAYATSDPEVAAAQQRLTVARSRLARQPGENSGQRREVEAAEEALAARVIAFRRTLRARRTGYEETAAALPSGGALVAFARYRREPARGAAKPTYMAFVLRTGDEAPIVVPLATAASVDALVAAWRREIRREAGAMGRNAQFNEQSYRTAGAALRRAVWDPVAAHLHGARSVFIVPDGALQLVNLNTLPIGAKQYLAEGGLVVHTLSAERDLAEERPHAAAHGLLAVGNPAFESARASRPPALVSRAGFRGVYSRCADFSSMQFAPLPASAEEVRSILSIWGRRGEGASVLLGADAGEAAFKQQAPGKRVIHLATHGFFLEEGCRNNETLAENPLLRAGLALAGANRRRTAGPDDEDGILTAEEVASLNLEGTEWAVLSGCDTGDGEVRAGEGVLGLRRAFRIAGVSTLIASLWPVEDETARAWMTGLYRAKFREGKTTSEAMTSATLSQLRQRRARGLSTHPFYWGSFIAVGDWR
jgi:CHAT domain-containing protein/Tfp pilus assembly protein PilF